MKNDLSIQEYRYNITRAVLFALKKDGLPPVFMCVGSNRVEGDCLGPAVGELLVRKHNIRTYVYGTREKPINSNNIIGIYNFIKRHHREKIFLIDAAIGKDEDFGKVKVYEGGVCPGAASNKNLQKMGDYSLLCNIGSFLPRVSFASVLKARLAAAAESIAFGISDAMFIRSLNLHKYL